MDMSSISKLMTNDHRNCDEIYADAEEAIGNEDFVLAASLWEGFCGRVEQHFSLEEETLFPGFENATGMQAGPTMVMRGEHIQMREMLKSISIAIDKKDVDESPGQCEPLMIFMQQHHMKEEQILYPMLDDTLPLQETTSTIAEVLA